jgi:hypothetical protein
MDRLPAHCLEDANESVTEVGAAVVHWNMAGGLYSLPEVWVMLDKEHIPPMMLALLAGRLDRRAKAAGAAYCREGRRARGG